MPSNRTSYQEGSIARVPRAMGPDQWVYRWWDYKTGKRKHRSKVIGSVVDLPTLADVRREVENFRAEINAESSKSVRLTLREAWGHFEANELRDPDVDRSPTTIQSYLDYFKCQILPKWGDVAIDDVKSVAVEKWLRSLDLSRGSKAKIRNHMSALFSHCIRHELYTKLNPIASVRQSAVRERDPDILTLEEIRAILSNIEPLAVRMMVATAAASALRRSELRGLKWADVDLEGCWFNIQRGLVRFDETKLKTRASRRRLEMNPALAEALLLWREKTPYNQDSDWIFASPYTSGERPYWPESAMKDHVKPAARKAGITKRVHWHVFRHSLASLLGQKGEQLKVVQEIVRHASSKITADIYQQADSEMKRNALSRVSGIFAVPAAS